MGGLSEHAVRFEIRPAPVLRARAKFRTTTPRKARLILTNLLIPRPDLEEVTTGLQLDVFLKAENLDDALQAGTTIAEGGCA